MNGHEKSSVKEKNPGTPAEGGTVGAALPRETRVPEDSSLLSIVLVEDSPLDSQLMQACLQDAGFVLQVTRVEDRESFQATLEACDPDLILSDYSLPKYSGRDALADARTIRPETPFIFYSGTIGEERAIETLREGALDYVLKDRPKRLVSAVQRALQESANKRAHLAAQERIVAQARLIDLASDAIVMISPDGEVLFWNQGAERLYGRRKEEVIGRNCVPILYSEPTSDFAEARRETLEKGSWQGELEHFCNGSKCIVWSRWTLVPDEKVLNGKGILTISSDITERKEFEAKFLRAQRLESVGAIASGIAHDLNNVLSPIRMATDVLLNEKLSEENLGLLRMIDQSAKRGGDMVNQVLTFVRGGAGKQSLIDLGTFIQETSQIVTSTFPRSIQVRVVIEDGLSPIYADPTQLHQVLMNLCVNARDAMPTGGTLTLLARNVEPSTVLIEVSDTGTGIPTELIGQIFDPFFTTKEPGKGTGLGLSTVAGIIKSHNGSIEVKSRPGQGTVFHVFLPVQTQDTGS